MQSQKLQEFRSQLLSGSKSGIASRFRSPGGLQVSHSKLPFPAKSIPSRFEGQTANLKIVNSSKSRLIKADLLSHSNVREDPTNLTERTKSHAIIKFGLGSKELFSNNSLVLEDHHEISNDPRPVRDKYTGRMFKGFELLKVTKDYAYNDSPFCKYIAKKSELAHKRLDNLLEEQ